MIPRCSHGVDRERRCMICQPKLPAEIREEAAQRVRQEASTARRLADRAAQARPSLEPPASDVAGWRLVPVEPTPEMVEAFYHAEGPAGPDRVVSWSVATAMARGNVLRNLDDIFSNGYRAMIAAAPPHPASKEVGDE